MAEESKVNEIQGIDNMVGASGIEQMMAESEQSFIHVQRFNDYVKEGLQMDQPVELIPHIVVEHETSIYFGDTGLGKSTHAMQMALDMAENGHKVIYVNFELSQQQFSKKYPGKTIPDNLFIANIDYTKMHDVTDQTQILGEIEQQALWFEADVIIIDNLTNLCINSKEGGEAGNVMLRLISLRMVHNWTMVILAHVPKRKASDPMSLNDLAGSKILSNLADNVVALNNSKFGSNKRYIKQLKYRSMPIELDEKNVLEMTLTMSEGYLHFEYGDYGEEYKHLPRSRDEKVELEREIANELKQPNGLSYREIAEKLGTSHGTVQRVAKNYGLSRKASEKKK